MNLRFTLLILVSVLVCGCQEPDEDPVVLGPSEQHVDALVLADDKVTISGLVEMLDTDYQLEELSFDVLWTYPDGVTRGPGAPKTIETTDNGAMVFSMHGPDKPPADTLEATEATSRPGIAVGTLYAYIDMDGDKTLCSSYCPDIRVGASPNTLVMYGDPTKLKDEPTLFRFNGGPGVKVQEGWFLAHSTLSECEGRPTVRDWEETDQIEVKVIGDFARRDRCEVRNIWPDVD